MKARNEVLAGIFVVVSLTLIAGLILIMGQERQVFARQSEFRAIFTDVKGLAEGAPVRLGGISIGRVAKVGFSADPADTRVHITLLINNDFIDRVRPDSLVAIETQGLLGDRFVSVSPGTQSGTATPGTVLPTVEIADAAAIMQKAQAAVENTTQITERINRSLEGLSPDTFKTLTAAAKSASELLTAISTHEGFLHRLIYSEEDGARLSSSLSNAAQDISATIEEVRGGKGLLHALIFEPNGKATVDSLLRTSSSLARILTEVEEGSGLAHDLLYSPIDPGSVARQMNDAMVALNAAAQNILKTSEALSSGSGTLGALIVDPQLYDNLVQLSGSAQRSFLLREMIRSSLNR